MENIRVVLNYLLVEVEALEKQSSGIVISDNVRTGTLIKAKVIKVSTDETEYALGDMVYFTKYKGDQLDDTRHIIHRDDIKAYERNNTN